jgi:hypothetical protein
MNISDLLNKKRRELEERKISIVASIDSSLNDLDAVQRLLKSGVLNEAEARSLFLGTKEETTGESASERHAVMHGSNGLMSRPSIRSAVAEAIRHQTGEFTVSQISSYIMDNYPGLDFDTSTVGIYLLRYFQEGMTVKRPDSKRGVATVYQRAEPSPS